MVGRILYRVFRSSDHVFVERRKGFLEVVVAPLGGMLELRVAGLSSCVGTDGSDEPQRFLSVNEPFDHDSVPSLQSYRAGLNTILSPRCVTANGDFIWFHPVTTATISSEAAHHRLNYAPL